MWCRGECALEARCAVHRPGVFPFEFIALRRRLEEDGMAEVRAVWYVVRLAQICPVQLVMIAESWMFWTSLAGSELKYR